MSVGCAHRQQLNVCLYQESWFSLCCSSQASSHFSPVEEFLPELWIENWMWECSLAFISQGFKTVITPHTGKVQETVYATPLCQKQEAGGGTDNIVSSPSVQHQRTSKDQGNSIYSNVSVSSEAQTQPDGLVYSTVSFSKHCSSVTPSPATVTYSTINNIPTDESTVYCNISAECWSSSWLSAVTSSTLQVFVVIPVWRLNSQVNLINLYIFNFFYNYQAKNHTSCPGDLNFEWNKITLEKSITSLCFCLLLTMLRKLNVSHPAPTKSRLTHTQHTRMRWKLKKVIWTEEEAATCKLHIHQSNLNLPRSVIDLKTSWAIESLCRCLLTRMKSLDWF